MLPRFLLVTLLVSVTAASPLVLPGFSSDANAIETHRTVKRTTWFKTPGLAPDGETYIETETCTDEQKDYLTKVLKLATEYAKAGAAAARDGSDEEFKKYFISLKYRQEVIQRFEAYAKEMSSTDEGAASITCQRDHPCSETTSAIADGTSHSIFFCSGFYEHYKFSTKECHSKDQASIVLHEHTHLRRVFDPKTDDNAYEYDNIVKLSEEEARLNADTYAIFAADAYRGCIKTQNKPDDLEQKIVPDCGRN